MNKITKLMCGVAPAAIMLAASLPTQTHAADLAMPAATREAGDFQGFYIGAHRGYGSAEYEGVWDSGSAPVTMDNAGYLLGIYAGYNWEIRPDIYAGLEGDITVAPWDATKSNDGTYAIVGHLTGIASLRGRLGYAFDRTLIYATGGVAFASSNAAGGDTIQHNRRAEMVVGPVAGAGVEWLVTPNLAIRGEGLYYWFDQHDSAPGKAGEFAGIQDVWMFRAGASWYFGNATDDAEFAQAVMGDAFSGFYVGAHTGYGGAEYSGRTDVSGGQGISFDNPGFLIGAHAGYNWRPTDHLVAGVEGDITVAPWDMAAYNEGNGSSYFVSGHLTGIASLRGRLGYAFDRSLIYATGGVAFASSNASGGATLEFNKRAEMVVGPVAGVGFEWLATPHIGLRAEGLYYWFDQTQGGNQGTGNGGIQNTWLARAGASYYFDPVTGNDAEPFVADFGGFYVGGHTGYGSAEYSGQVTSPASPSEMARPDFGGYLIGAHAGYNWQFTSRAIAGLEWDMSLAPWDGAEAADHDSVFVSGHLTGVASLRGRLGYALDRTLIYATGGIAFASSNASGGHTLQYNRKAELEIGPVAGAGFEWMATQNVSLRAEGLYYWFDQKQSGNGGSGFAGISNTWAARVGASWYFN